MNPLAFLSPYKAAFEILAALAIIAGISYEVHHYLDGIRLEQRAADVAEFTAKELKATQEAQAKEQALNAQLQDARNALNTRDQTIRSLAAAGAVSVGGLRDTLATIRNGVPSASVDALGKSVSALATVLNECQSGYRQMAENADRHASDSLMYQQAWPK